ncbi:MAG: hypothetical protein M3N17_08585 [Actinomycetota bacterium]|nr:hypothetical protein [Actinomycetota bacterium]
MNKVSVLARSVAAGTITVTSRALRLAAQAGDQVASRVRPQPPKPVLDPDAGRSSAVTDEPSGEARPAVERAFDDETIPPTPVDPLGEQVQPPLGADVEAVPEDAAPVVEDVVEPPPLEDLDEPVADEVPEAFAEDVEAAVAPPTHPEEVVGDLDSEEPLVVSGPDPVVTPPESVPEGMTEGEIAALAERNAPDVVAVVPDLSTRELRLLLEHETANKNRKTVLRAVEAAAESRPEV